MIVTIEILKALSEEYYKPRKIFRLIEINKLQQLLEDRVQNIIKHTEIKE